MLFWYFLYRLLFRFVAVATSLIVAFSLVHFFLRVSLDNIIMLIPIIFFTMVPMILQYVVPIASGAATYMIMSELVQHQEVFLLYALNKAQQSLRHAILLFSVCIGVLYGVLVCFWIPQSYAYGKAALLKIAQQQFLHYEPKVMHEPLPGLSLVFEEKKIHYPNLAFKNLFLSCKTKKETYYFTAQEGIISDTFFLLERGSLLSQTGTVYHYATFAKTLLNVQQLISLYNKQEHKKPPAKYLAWHEIQGFEVHKRLAQGLWQFCIPLMLFFLLFFMPARKNSMLESFFMAGLLFLCMYLCLMLGQVFGGIGGLLCLYFPPVILLCVSLYRYYAHS